METPGDDLPLRPDDWAEAVFPDWQRMSPEEYAARNGHLFLAFSFDNYRYPNQNLQAWVHRLGQLLNDPVEVERLRQDFLTPEERERIAQEVED